MNGLSWSKTSHSEENDPFILGLTDRQFRIWYHLKQMASQADERGTIPSCPTRGLAERLRASVQQLKSAIEVFAQGDLIRVQPDGSILVVGWLRQQYEKESDWPCATRARQQKKRSLEQAATTLADTADVTPLSRAVTPSHAIERERESDSESRSTNVDLESDSVPIYAHAGAELSLSGGDEQEAFDDGDDKPLSELEYVQQFVLLQQRYPTKNGKALDFSKAFKKFTYLTRRDWRLVMIAVDNYRRSIEVEDGVVCNPETFLEGRWRRWQTPEVRPPNHRPRAAPAVAVPLVACAAPVRPPAGRQIVVQAAVSEHIPPDKGPPAEQPADEDSPPYSPWIAGVVADYSRELGDANVAGNVQRALRAWRRSGLPEQGFVETLHQAHLETRRRQGPGRRKIDLFFASLDALCAPALAAAGAVPSFDRAVAFQ